MTEIGNKYGRLTIVGLAGGNEGRKPSQWRYDCVCECGNKRAVVLHNLKSGTTKACGCWQREVASRIRKPNGRVNKRGYRVVPISRTSPYWPMARKCETSTCNGNIFEHRLVMAQHLGRCLEPWEIVHHKNHIRHDNRIENLELISRQAEHDAETFAHTHLVEMKNQIKKLNEEKEWRLNLTLRVLDHYLSKCPTNDGCDQFQTC